MNIQIPITSGMDTATVSLDLDNGWTVLVIRHKMPDRTYSTVVAYPTGNPERAHSVLGGNCMTDQQVAEAIARALKLEDV